MGKKRKGVTSINGGKIDTGGKVIGGEINTGGKPIVLPSSPSVEGKVVNEGESDKDKETEVPGSEVLHAAGTEVTAANISASKKKRKKRNKGKGDEAGGMQDTGEDVQLAKKLKTENLNSSEENTMLETEASVENKPQLTETDDKQESAAPVILTSPKKTKSKRRKERRKKIKLAIEAAVKNKMLTENQNTTTTTTTAAGTTAVPEVQGETGKKRKLKEADSSKTNANGSLKENEPAKKMKLGNTEEKDAQKEVASLGNEELTKKKKRRRKKKKKNFSGNSEISNDNKDKEEKENTEARNLTETTQTVQDKEDKPETKAKKKRKRKKKKTQTNLTDASKDSNTHTAPTNNTQDNSQAPVLHPSCTSKENKKKIKEYWKSGCEDGLVTEDGSIEVIKNPFTCCYLPRLLQDEAYLDGVKKELESIELMDKNNDLYKFQQTADLRDITTPFISGLRRLLCSDVRQWLIDITGIPLSEAMDMGSSRYSQTDVLLCHDDELEGRRIAYILYLVPPWGPEDGGSLDLFGTDGSGHPSDIIKSLTPQNNAFAFFEVSPVSFHQVSEVLSRDKTRLSINGWFHGPAVPRPKRNPPPPSPLNSPSHLEEDDFYAWINPMYLDENIQKEIRQKFCSESELQLQNFLTDEAHEKLSKAFRGEPLAWKHMGPADRQCYKILDPEDMPQDVKECREFLGCEALFLVLSQLTGLKLHSLAPQDSDGDEEDEEASNEFNPRCHVEAQRWGPGCYTLVRDDCVDACSALDAFLYISVPKWWTQKLGGHVTYIAKDEDEELLTVVPQTNCLCLVYRDPQTLRFTKYITKTAKDLGADPHFYNFACTYYE